MDQTKQHIFVTIIWILNQIYLLKMLKENEGNENEGVLIIIKEFIGESAVCIILCK